MIRALRRKFILITMSLLTLVFAVALAALNVGVRRSERSKMLAELESLSGARRIPRFSVRVETPPAEEFMPDALPAPGGWSADMEIRETYFIRLDENGEVTENRSVFDFAVEADELQAVISEAVGSGRKSGVAGSYMYLIEPRRSGSMLILRSCEELEASMRRLLFYSLLVGLAGLAVLFGVTVFLSRLVTAPAERAFMQQKQFVADASHELKTPLSAISVNAEVLERDIGPNRWLGNIRSECGRMEELVLSLLTLARMEAEEGKPPETAPVNFSELCEQAVLTYECMAYEHHVAFTSEVAAGVTVRGSEGELKQLIAALLDNAFKFTEPGGAVTLTAKREEEHAVLRITNTGAEIPAEDLPHIFERFYRADRARTGTSFGLGLAICREITERHRGSICAESKNGETAFTVRL